MDDFFKTKMRDGSGSDVLTVDSLHQVRKQRLENRQRIYDTVLHKCNNRIEYFNKYMHQDCCYFEIPEYIYGLPSFDVKKCTMYLMMILRQRGFICEYRPLQNREGRNIPILFISWNIRKTKQQTKLLLGGPNSNVRDDSYVFERNGGQPKQYVFEKPKIEPQMTNLLMAPNSDLFGSDSGYNKTKRYRKKVKPLRPKKRKRDIELESQGRKFRDRSRDNRKSRGDRYDSSSDTETKVIDYDPNSALSGLKLRAELIRQKNRKEQRGS